MFPLAPIAAALLAAAAPADATPTRSGTPTTGTPPLGPAAAPADTPGSLEARPPANWTVPAAHAGGVLLGMRLTVSLAWPEAYDPTRFGHEREQLRLAFTRPPEFHADRGVLEWDGDPWWVNGIGHAAFGSEVYGRTRQCGGGPTAALLLAAGATVAWEYGLEAPHKRPSAVDLVWTPLAGALLGEGRFRLHRWLRARNASTWLLFVVDPLGESERRLLHTRC